MAVTQTGSTGVKSTGDSSATHDLSFAMPGDADFCRITVSFTNIGVTVSSVTWDQGGANQACSRPSGMSAVLENGDGHRCDEYVLIAPTVGTHTLRVVFSGSVDGPVIGITAYKGVDSGTPVSGFQSFVSPGPGDTASPTNLPTITSATDDLVVESLGCRFGDLSGFTIDGSQTVEADAAETTLGGGALKSSHKAGAATVTMQYTFTGTKHYTMLGYNIKAAATEPPSEKVIWDLLELTEPAVADLLPTVDDPDGTPSTKKLSLANLGAALAVMNVVVQTKTVGSGTYTPTTGMKKVLAIAVGGGGGGAGGVNTDSAGGGGGGGGTCIRLLTAAQIGASKAYVVGGGGAADSAGGNTTLDAAGALMSASGGSAGTAGAASTTLGTQAAGGAGGAAANGDLNMPGERGGRGVIFDTTNGMGGLGGRSVFGTRTGIGGSNVAGQSSTTYGAGGAGGHASATANRAGSAGSDGVLYLIEFIAA